MFMGRYESDEWVKIVDTTNGIGSMIMNSVTFPNQITTTFSLSYYTYNGVYRLFPKLVSGGWNLSGDNQFLFDIRYKYESGRLRVWIKDHAQGAVNFSYCGVPLTWIHESLPADTVHPSTDDVNLLSFNDIIQNTSNLTRLADALRGL